MSEWIPTGRKRYRVHPRAFKSDLLVLQLEFGGIGTTFIAGRVESKSEVIWRDARVSDITVGPFKGEIEDAH